MSSLLVHCHGEKTHFSKNEKNVFVKPNEHCRVCSYIVMARKRTSQGERKECFIAFTLLDVYCLYIYKNSRFVL